MSEQGYLEVKNWKQFQHYRDRDPKWIKLYRSVLADYAFSRLQDASKMHLVGIWLLASELHGRVPNDPEWIARRLGATEPVDIQVLVDAGFLTLARRKQDASRLPAKRLPRERVRERDISEPRTTWLTPFAEAWQTRCGEPQFGPLAKYLGPLVKSLGEPEALARWTRYLEANEPRYCAPARFAATHAAYAGPAIVEMTDDFGRMVPHRKNEAGEWVPVVTVA